MDSRTPEGRRSPGLADDDTGGLTGSIIGAAIDVHRHFGPGLLERSYEDCLAIELAFRGHEVDQQVYLPIVYRGVRLRRGYRLDIVVDDAVVVEVKAVERIAPVHVSQVVTYLRLTGHRAGLLFNFNVRALAAGGIRRLLPPRSSGRAPGAARTTGNEGTA